MQASRIFVAAAALMSVMPAFADTQQWSTQKANQWYAQQRWLVGSNYIPADAINQLEMWQADTFNAAQIDKELGWAESIGMNTMRVFLHDKLWEQDAEGFKKRIDQFLAIAAKHGIRPMLVFFDSCWDPDPKLGPQRPPIPGVHNSGWVQSPGRAGLADAANYHRLEAYVQDGLWLRLAGHANAMAGRLADGIAGLPGVRLAHPVEVNEIFAQMPRAMIDGLLADGFGLYDRGGGDVRLVTAFNNTREQIDAFVAAARRLA